MKVTPVFIVASLVCAAPFAFAVRDDLTHKRPMHGAFDADEALENYRRDYKNDDPSIADLDYPSKYESHEIKPADLAELFGSEPASMGPVLDGLKVGASSLDFQSETSRTRIEAFKLDHDVTVDFDFDEVSLNGIDVAIEGDEEELRAALVDRWGTPRRGGEDELVWLGADQTRAVYSSRYDGFVIRFESYATIEEIIAPGDKTKLGFEPFPIVGTAFPKLEAAFGNKLQPSDDYEGEAMLALPGIGAGAGKTMVQLSMNDDAKITVLAIEAATYDGDAVRDALIQKWGKPKEDGDALEWRKGGITISAQFYDQGFSLVERK